MRRVFCYRSLVRGRFAGAGVGVTLGYVVRGLCGMCLGGSHFQLLQMTLIWVTLGARVLGVIVAAGLQCMEVPET